MMGRGIAFGYGTYGCGGLIPMILIIAVLGMLIFLIAKRPARYREHQEPQAVSILNERLAKGEITSEEYEKLKKTIKH